jgi:uncharacterized protein
VSDPPPAGTAAFLVRVPEVGKVKTRLAADLGPEEATRIYARMARQVVDRLRAGPWRLQVHWTGGEDPAPGSADAPPEPLLRWLDADATLSFHPQSGGDLGMRMERAMATALASRAGGPAAVLASDVPDLGPRHLEEAFRMLNEDRADLVLGPCPDGGYYLLALRAPEPSLFRDMPWSTDRVADRTLERARAGGLRTHLLELLVDVDRAADLSGTGFEPGRTDLP